MRKKSPETTFKILDAARAIVLEKGLNSLTMEAIAKRAGIAKGTLYAYFPDKDTVSTALAEHLAETASEAFAEAFVGQGPIAERVGRGLGARFGAISDLLESSDFARDLLGDHNRLANADKAIGEVIIAEMAGAGIADAEKIAPVLMAAGAGIAQRFASGRAVRAALMLLCEKMVR